MEGSVRMEEPSQDDSTLQKDKKRKRGSGTPTPVSSDKKKRRSSVKATETDKSIRSEDSKEDEVWHWFIDSLKKYTESELKMFKSPEEGEGLEVEVEEVMSENSHLDYSTFLCSLVDKFTKLRRFPKLIAKLLCCLRDQFVRSGSSVPNAEEAEKKGIPALCLLLPMEFMEITRPVIESLPGGQIIDLWKTLHHNLKEECLNSFKGVCDTKGHKTFLQVVSELFCHFLMHVRVVDHSVQAITVEKVGELMSSLNKECLVKFGSNILEYQWGKEFVEPFLKLAYSWAELQGLQFHYNNQRYNCKMPEMPLDSSPANLSYLHNYMASEMWLKIDEHVSSLEDTSCSKLFAKLVAQKLKFMLTLKSKISTGEEEDEEQSLLEENLNAASKFIFTNQAIYDSRLDAYTLASDFLDSVEIIELSMDFVSDLNCNILSEKDLPHDFQMQHSIILEMLVQTMNRLAKIKCFKKQMIEIVDVVLSPDNRSLLIKQDPMSKQVAKDLLRSVNTMIENGLSCKSSEVDFSSDLIIGHIGRISQLNLGDYPLQVQTVLLLSALIIFVAFVKTLNMSEKNDVDDSVLNMLSSIIYHCGHEAEGNEAIFSVNWKDLFNYLRNHLEVFSEQAMQHLLPTILKNIYVSSKSIVEFEPHFDFISDNFKVSSTTVHTNMALITVEFLNKELTKASRAKSKVVPQIRSNVEKLTNSCIEFILKRNNKRGVAGCSKETLARCGWLLRLITRSSDDGSKTEVGGVDASKVDEDKLRQIFKHQLTTGLELFDSKLKSKLKIDAEDLTNAKAYALLFLQSLCKSSEEFKDILPSDLTSKLWNINRNISTDILNFAGNIGATEKLHLLPALICTFSSTEEFESILSSLTVDDTAEFNIEKISSTIKIVDNILESKLTNEKKSLRTNFLEEFLYSSLQYHLEWNASQESITKLILPFFNFQGNLVSRKRPLCSTSALAICLVSITSTPLSAITDTSVYRKVFCAAADLLNSFTVHRLDVISSRTHIYLQSFQFLIESLTTKSDQKNKLSDEEVVDLRYCSHAMERICQSTKAGRKEFARIAPYFLAIMMKQFELCTVYPIVKDPLLSASYKLLNLCDKHGIAQLNSMLTVGSREIFTRIYELYNKFYRYKGRV